MRAQGEDLKEFAGLGRRFRQTARAEHGCPAEADGKARPSISTTACSPLTWLVFPTPLA
jgi:hypothetical protein